MNANKTFRAARPPTRALKIKMDKSDKYNEVTLQKKININCENETHK